MIVSLIFMVQMTLYNSVVLYLPSLSLQSILGISDTISIGAVGASCLLYCTLGGIKAVIWTDFFQAGLMFLAMICIGVGGALEVGGFSHLIEVNRAGGRLSLDHFFQLDLSTRHTIFTLSTGAVIINVFMNGANQIQVQRALSLPSLRQAQWSQLLAAIFTLLISFVCSFLGLILYANYKDCDPFLDHQIDKRDAILIYYISSHLSNLPGLRGMFVAGIFAATLSTLSSFQNSMSALLLEDFIKPARSKPMGEKSVTRLSKCIALGFGLACIGLTFVVGRISGLLQVVYTLFGSLGSPFIGAFFMGMLTRFTNTLGITLGMLSGFALGIYVQLYQTFYLPPLEPTRHLSTSGCANFNTSNIISQSILSQKSTASHEGIHQQLVHMSYLWVPAITLTITMLVSALVSLPSGGLQQQVEDKYLAGWLHTKKVKSDYVLSDSLDKIGDQIKAKESKLVV